MGRHSAVVGLPVSVAPTLSHTRAPNCSFPAGAPITEVTMSVVAASQPASPALWSAVSPIGTEHVVAAAASPDPPPTARPVVLFAISKEVAGDLICVLNQRALGKNSTSYKKVKAALNLAVQAYWSTPGLVQVHPQGSAAKGTGIDSSDYDFFLSMDESLPPMTRKQRSSFAALLQDHLKAQGLSYFPQLGENRIHLIKGKYVETGEKLPEVDVLFERFCHDVRTRPNNRSMVGTPVGQQVVRLMKLMRKRYNNLVEPVSFRLEEYVRLVQDDIQIEVGEPLVGAEGFGALLGSCLARLARYQDTTEEQEICLVAARMRGVDDHWERAARRALPALMAGNLKL